jgi:serine/threonine protein kinase
MAVQQLAIPVPGTTSEERSIGEMGEGLQSMQLQEEEMGGGSTSGGAPPVGELSRSQHRIDSDLLEIPYDELELDKKIGRGSFGEVYKCQWRGTTIAVKVLTDQALSEETLAEFRTEVNMMNKVRHPNVVLLMGICSTPPHLSIIT